MNRKDNRTVLDCKRRFSEGGLFFHLYTKPLEDALILKTKEELDLALNVLAMAIFDSSCVLLAFAIMNNHFHFILEGAREDCLLFYKDFQQRLAKILAKEHRSECVRAATPFLTLIESLEQLRNEIVYVVRNPFVDRTDVNPFSYKWCSGYLYFNEMLDLMPKGELVCEWSIARRRAFKHKRDADVDPKIRALNGVALPSCFTDYRRAMSFFENARQFTNWMLKSVEAQMEIAKRIGEQVMLDDIELWQVVMGQCRNTFYVKSPKELSAENRVRLIKTLKYDYSSSNAQIARCLGVPRNTIDQMFPMSARS